MEKTNLTLSEDSKPEDALDLPKGRVAFGSLEASFSSEDVIECTKFIIEKGDVEEVFYSQAGVIVYAGNNLGWGAGQGYSAI